MVTKSTNVDEIYHQMTVIRRELHANVSQSVAGAEAVVDWGRYTWVYPWIAVGAAAVVGYVVYTSTNQKVAAGTATPAEGTVAGEPVASVERKVKESSRTIQNLLLTVGGIVLPVAISAGQNYLLRLLEQQYPTRRPGGTAPASSPWASERAGSK